MSAKAIREVDGKRLLNQHLKSSHFVRARVISIDENTRWSDVTAQHPWTKQEALVVKPDQLIKRRGKLGLVGVNLNLEAAEKWVGQRMNKNTNVRFKFFSTNHECIDEYYFSLLFLWNSIVLHRFYWFSLLHLNVQSCCCCSFLNCPTVFLYRCHPPPQLRPIDQSIAMLLSQ